MVRRRMLCSKEGHQDGNMQKRHRVRDGRCWCLTMIDVALDTNTLAWSVVTLVDQHNHDMVTLSKRCYLGGNRVITPRSRALFQSLNTSNIAPSDQYSVVTMEAGGYESMTFMPSDFSNMRWDNPKNVCYCDVDLLLEFLGVCIGQDLGYYYSFTKHDDGMKSSTNISYFRMIPLLLILLFTNACRFPL